MRDVWTRLLLLLAIPAFALAQTDLPENDDYESFEVEPPSLLPNAESVPEKSLSASVSVIRDPVELEKLVERAKRVAAEAERLYKRGILSRVEVELRALRIVRLQSDLEKARLERAKADLAIQQTRFEMGEISKEALAEAQRSTETAEQTAEAAALARDRAEIAAAEKN
ncbi:MAG TPA: hypothetical protein VJ719_08950, partial [Chthoniobacterales bacterium]|nr:hypothetical protein [Chthoniobacterales bacterium]